MFRWFFAAGLANPEGVFVITDKDTEQVIDQLDVIDSIIASPCVAGVYLWYDHIGVGSEYGN